MIELRHLRYFLAVAEAAHFTRAAEAIYVSQPTLSQQIKQLEADLGTTLFDRIGKRVMLTEAGKILQAHAQRIFTELEQAQQAIQELEGLQRGELAVGEDVCRILGFDSKAFRLITHELWKNESPLRANS